MSSAAEYGIVLENGCRITHGDAAGVKRPFSHVPVVMHEMAGDDDKATQFRGQFGFIPFTHEMRLPRHVHMTLDHLSRCTKFLAERILVLHGIALTELGGELFVVAPGSLVDIAPGIPHTWTACPSGLQLPDGTVSNGKFTMVYNYENITAFSPTRSTHAMKEVAEYEPFEGNLEDITFPQLSPLQVVEHGNLIWNRDVRQGLAVV